MWTMQISSLGTLTSLINISSWITLPTIIPQMRLLDNLWWFLIYRVHPTEPRGGQTIKRHYIWQVAFKAMEITNSSKRITVLSATMPMAILVRLILLASSQGRLQTTQINPTILWTTPINHWERWIIAFINQTPRLKAILNLTSNWKASYKREYSLSTKSKSNCNNSSIWRKATQCS